MIAPTTSESRASAAPGRPVGTQGELVFKIEVQGRVVGRFAECTGLAAEYEVTEYSEGGNNEFVHKLRGRVRYPNVTLRRGITFEDALLRWFYATAAPTERPVVTITLLDQVGKPIRRFALRAAQPVRWTGPSAMSGSNSAATESLEVSHEGFA